MKYICILKHCADDDDDENTKLLFAFISFGVVSVYMFASVLLCTYYYIM